MKKKATYTLLFIAACTVASCKKPYTPDIVAANNNYLVVEGNINTGSDSTTISLSRTTNIASGITTKPELNAKIIIQDNQNQSYSLTDKGTGAYTSDLLSLDPTRTYRLSITTSDGKTYLSDYVPATVSPAIDSVGFKAENNDMQVYVNTHDPKNTTHYYHWDYIETWEFHADYDSDYITNGTAIVRRTPGQEIYKCWASDPSTNVELASSAKLTQDVIYQQLLTTVPSTSEKIETRYSILVKQYAMTAAGYNYYALLKQNTEQLGSIFDPQPSTLTGNIHCTTDPSLPVIGYVTAGTYAQKRIYINNTQLPSNWRTTYPYGCEVDTALNANPKSTPPQDDVLYLLIPLNSIFIPIDALGTKGYLYSTPDCVDCSLRGSTTAPAFWTPGPYDN